MGNLYQAGFSPLKFGGPVLQGGLRKFGISSYGTTPKYFTSRGLDLPITKA